MSENKWINVWRGACCGALLQVFVNFCSFLFLHYIGNFLVCFVFQESKIPNITALPSYRKMRGMSSSMGKPVSRHNLPLLELGLGASSSSMLAALSSSLNNSNHNSASGRSSSTSTTSISNANYNHQQIPPVSEFICDCVPGWDGPTCEISK